MTPDRTPMAEARRQAAYEPTALEADISELGDEESAPSSTLLAAQANPFGEYMRAWGARVRSGDSGMLSVLIGLVGISIIFQSLNANFLSAGNLTNLLVQGAVFMLLGMGEVFALLLGEIDLSIGFVSGIGGVVAADLVVYARSWPWWAAVLIALLATTAIGALQGSIITRFHLPSFVVTLAGLLGWEGVMILLLGQGGTIPIPNNVINGFANGNMTKLAGWIVMIAIVGAFALIQVSRALRRRSRGLAPLPTGMLVLKVAAAAAAGTVLVLVCNTNRSTLSPVSGLPWVVPIVLGVLFFWTMLLARTRFGRYVYAIGGSPEGARRAGINLARVRTVAFALSGLTAGIGGIVYASRLRSVSTSLDGGTLVLYSVAAAVIGGTSLFGGRGKPLHAVLGGVVIASIYNGMGLLGMSAAAQYIITALVLLVAVTVDSVARRGHTAPSS